MKPVPVPRFDGTRLRSGRRVIGLGALVLCLAASLASAREPEPAAAALIAELGLVESPTALRDSPDWRAPKRIVVARLTPPQLAELQAVVPGVELLAAAPPGAARDAQLAEADAVIGLCDADTLAAAPKLRWIQTLNVGVEGCVGVPGLAARGILLTNMQRTSAAPIAEHAIALMLALGRGLPEAARQQQAGRWNPEAVTQPSMREVGGRTMLVVGLGGIGTEVARRAHALGMRVIATRNSSREGPDFVARVGLSDELLALAAEADVVVNAAPLTPATTDLFDRAFFDAMKPGGWFINVARGRSVVTEDLVAALRDGRLAGAGLDVTEPEPLPEGHALWSLPNVIITPHVAAQSDVQSGRYAALLRENLRRYAAGERMLNVVDIARGY
jgi:phosphoglycerate dehydrogenase-like enzyme